MTDSSIYLTDADSFNTLNVNPSARRRYDCSIELGSLCSKKICDTLVDVLDRILQSVMARDRNGENVAKTFRHSPFLKFADHVAVLSENDHFVGVAALQNFLRKLLRRNTHDYPHLVDNVSVSALLGTNYSGNS